MEKTHLSTTQSAFGISLAIASLANALLVTLKEKSPKLLALMKGMTGHHWITHSLFIVVLFLILGFIVSGKNGSQESKFSVGIMLSIVVGGIVTSGLVIVGFYLIEG